MKRTTWKVAVALVAFARSKEGRKLIHQFARSREGRKLLRQVKKHPGGKRIAKLAQSG